MNRADTVHDKCPRVRDCLTALRPFGKGATVRRMFSGGPGISVREDGYPSAKRPFAPAVPAARIDATHSFRASIMLCSVALIIMEIRRLSTLRRAICVFLSLLCGIFRSFLRLSVQPVKKKGDARGENGLGTRLFGRRLRCGRRGRAFICPNCEFSAFRRAKRLTKRRPDDILALEKEECQHSGKPSAKTIEVEAAWS